MKQENTYISPSCEEIVMEPVSVFLDTSFGNNSNQGFDQEDNYGGNWN